MMDTIRHNRILRFLFISLLLCSFITAPTAIGAEETEVTTVAEARAAVDTARSAWMDESDPVEKQKKYETFKEANKVLQGINRERKEEAETGLWESIGHRIGNIILSTAALVTWLGGMLLDTAVSELVLGMSAMIEGGMDAAIDSSWSTIRDVANLIFIFGFVYIGILTIYDYENANTKRTLVAIIIAALLINFSLFFTKVIVDVSNVLAVEIYETLINPTDPTGDISGIAAAAANQLGLTSFYSQPEANIFANLTTGGNVWFYIAGAIFLLIAGFVFAAGGVLLIIRFVALLFIMVFSPILFAATVFPQTGDAAKSLWKLLLKYAFFAPVYLFLIYVALKLIEGSSLIIKGNGELAEALANGGGSIDSFGVILNFVIIIMFLIMALLAANKLSIAGGDQAIKVGKSLRGYGQRALGSGTVGAAAAIGRSTAGRFGKWATENEKLKDKAESSWTARQALKLSNQASKASFDARRVGGAGKALGIGEGKKGGYAARVAAAQKREDEFTKLLGQVPDDDVRVKAREQEVKNQEAEIRRLQAKKDAAISADDKAKFANRIAAEKEGLQKAKDLVEQEKNRRVIGSSYISEKTSEKTEGKIGELDKEIKDHKDAIKNGVKNFVNATDDAERAGYEKAVKDAQKALKEAEAQQLKTKQEAGAAGYAGVVEGRGWLSSQVTGRNRGINRTVGKKLRKEYSKKIKGPKTSEKGTPSGEGEGSGGDGGDGENNA